MFPEMEFVDYIVILVSIPASIVVLAPCIVAAVILFIKNRSIGKKALFSFASCVLAYGLAVTITAIIITPIGIINTFLTPKWQMLGYDELGNVLQTIEALLPNFLFIGTLIISSVIVPLKLVKVWPEIEKS
jgi:hypothetical protein